MSFIYFIKVTIFRNFQRNLFYFCVSQDLRYMAQRAPQYSHFSWNTSNFLNQKQLFVFQAPFLSHSKYLWQFLKLGWRSPGVHTGAGGSVVVGVVSVGFALWVVSVGFALWVVSVGFALWVVAVGFALWVVSVGFALWVVAVGFALWVVSVGFALWVESQLSGWAATIAIPVDNINKHLYIAGYWALFIIILMIL